MRKLCSIGVGAPEPGLPLDPSFGTAKWSLSMKVLPQYRREFTTGTYVNCINGFTFRSATGVAAPTTFLDVTNT